MLISPGEGEVFVCRDRLSIYSTEVLCMICHVEQGRLKVISSVIVDVVKHYLAVQLAIQPDDHLYILELIDLMHLR